MSRVGKQPINIPAGVKVAIDGLKVTVEASGKSLNFTHRRAVSVRVDEDAKAIIVERANDNRESKALHGLTRALVQNMVLGVTTGFVKELEISGVGWTAQLKGQTVSLNVGYADSKIVPVPNGVSVDIKGSRIKVSGPDKQLVGQCAAQIRAQRKPEPYNGKGIMYVGEKIIRKEGKALAG